MAEGTRRTFAKSVKKRQEIIDAAAKILAQKGYAEATLSDISKEIGTHAGSIYYYFESREELVREVLLTSLTRMHDALLRGMHGMSTQCSGMEKLSASIRAVIELFTDRKDDYSRAYIRSFNQLPEGLTVEINAKRRDVRNIWHRLLSDVQKDGAIPADTDINLATLFVVGATNWVTFWYSAQGGRSSQDIADAYTSFVLRGLSGGPLN